MNVFARSRLRLVPLLACLLLASGSLGGCHKDNEPDNADSAPTKDSVKQSYAALQLQLGGLNARFSVLQKQLEALPPDLEGFGDARGKLFSAEEVLGVTTAKTTWLSSQVDSAQQTQKPEDLQKVSNAIAATAKDLAQVDHVGLELTHKLASFERTAVLLQNPRDAGAAAKSIP